MKLAAWAAGVCLPAIVVLFACGAGASAQTGPEAVSPIKRIGTEFQANKIIKFSQVEPSVAGLPNGNFVVAWQDGSGTAPDIGYAVRARIFNPSGVAVGDPDFLVPNRYDLSQGQAQAIGLKNGFLIGWADNGNNGGDQEGMAIRSRRFTNAGVPTAGQTTVNQITGGDQYYASISKIPTGGYIAGWFDGCFCDGDTGYQVRGQVFNEEGKRVGTSFRAATDPEGTQDYPSVTGLSTGESVIVWEDGNFLPPEQDPDRGTVVRGQLIGTDGKKKGENFLVHKTIRGQQGHPDVAALGKDRYVVVWEDDNGTSAVPNFDVNIRAQVRDAAGKVGGEFVVNTTLEEDQRFPKALGLGGGKFLVCWVDLSQTAPDFSGNAIRCQAFKMGRTKASKYGPEFVANGRKTNDQGYEFGFRGSYSLTLLKNGDFVVVWEDWSGAKPDRQSGGIRGQVFRLN